MFWNTVRNGPSRSSKVVNFGTNRKRVCDFLLVINSNLGPILPRFRDIAGFLRERPHPYSTLGLDCRCCGSEERYPKLIIRVINFELVQPMTTVHHGWTDRQTDGRTNGRTTYDSNTALALRASRGKMLQWSWKFKVINVQIAKSKFAQMATNQ